MPNSRAMWRPGSKRTGNRWARRSGTDPRLFDCNQGGAPGPDGEWVQGHLTEELTADRLARQACVSKRTLARRFVETTGTSPAAWVVGLRIARVKELLETTTLSIEEVADKCGFGSSFA